jgi:uncharacterized metal-binding protein
MAKKVIVFPCSGIGKPFGEIGRQAVYHLINDLRPGQTDTTCLALLMMDDPEAKELIMNNYVVTVDGCPMDCAKKNVEHAGKVVDASLRTISVFAEHKDLKPEGILDLGEPGMKLAYYLADKLAVEVDKLLAKEEKQDDC